MHPTSPNHRTQKIVASFTVILAVVFVTVGVSAYNAEQKSNQQTATTSQTAPTSQPKDTTSGLSSNSATAVNSSGYKDGTFSASATYYVPPGRESIKVTLTVRGGIVTDSQITNSESNSESAAYQQDFVASYKSYVVGKNIGNIHLNYVAGASDTTDGFNEAMLQIQNQAKA